MTWIVNWQTPDALTDGIIDVLEGESLEFSFDAIDPSINLSLNWGGFTAHLPGSQSYDLETVGSGTYELDGVSAWINATENNEFQQYYWSKDDSSSYGQQLSLEELSELSGISFEKLQSIEVFNPEAKIPSFRDGLLSEDLSDGVLDIISGESPDAKFTGSYTGDTTLDWILLYSYKELTTIADKTPREINRYTRLNGGSDGQIDIPFDFLRWVEGTWDFRGATLWGLQKGSEIKELNSTSHKEQFILLGDAQSLQKRTGINLPESIEVINKSENLDLTPPQVAFISATPDLKQSKGITIDSDSTKEYTYEFEVDDGTQGSGLGDLMLMLEHFPWDSPMQPYGRQFRGYHYSNPGYVADRIGIVGASLKATVNNPPHYWGSYNDSDLQFIPHFRFTDKAGNSTVEFEGPSRGGTQSLLNAEFQGEIDYIVNGIHPEKSPIWVKAIDITGQPDPISNFSLDVDGDGQTTALGDGLMIIRKLFGSAFSGDALTHKARSDAALRSAEQIHDFIQVGIDSRALDVDNDGKVTALGDGLMIIRHLFGSAFSGSALINKAISHDSDYYGQANAWQSVASNIDALMPDLS